jgi:hypothetical protein
LPAFFISAAMKRPARCKASAMAGPFASFSAFNPQHSTTTACFSSAFTRRVVRLMSAATNTSVVFGSGDST